MASHFSTIGLPVKSEDEFLDLARRVVDSATGFDCNEGRYLRWSSPGGAELWLQVDADNDFIGMNPHYAGAARISVGLTARVDRPRGSALDSAFHGWAAPIANDPQSGCYPFVFDVPDFQLHQDFHVPGRVEVQIAAFAQEVSLFESPEVYSASQEGAIKFASRSFIPSGLFNPPGKDPVPPEANAIFTGHVLDVAERWNELTENRFYWALVETLGGEFDVVIDPTLVDTVPKIGGVVSGSFWLSGRLLD
jgi:hypothetical protein